MQPILFYSKSIAGKVDPETGIISGVSVLTEGQARGHDQWVDATTLRQVKAAAETFTGGVRVKLNHYGGIESIIGSIDNFRIEGKKLLGDLHLLKAHDSYKHVIELAKAMPEICGLSISFSGVSEPGTLETEFGAQKVDYARCTELYSIDLVDEPAANPTGLFQEDREARWLRSRGLAAPKSDEGWVDFPTQPRMDDKTFMDRLRQAVGLSANDETVPKTAFVLLEAGHKELISKFTKAETDLSSAQSKVIDLEKAKKELGEKQTELQKQLDTQKTTFEAAVKEHAGKEAATILSKLGIAPITQKPDANANPGSDKTLLEEYNAITDAAKKTEFYSKYGGSNIVNNVRKTA